MNEVVIIAAVRTPIGSFGGVLSTLSATDLGAAAIQGALSRAGVSPDQVQEVYMGNVVSANVGQAPAKQAALKAGLPATIPCTTINKVCASGTKAIMLAAQAIQLGQADVIIAGGMESMSNVPYYVPKARFGYKYGNAELVDGLARDGLVDVYDQCSMGVFADRTAEKYAISREAQDAYSVQSYKRAEESTQSGRFSAEIIPVEVAGRKGSVTVTEDEEYKNVIYDKIPTLKPAFGTGGTVTAASSSPISDGASALVVMSRRKADELGLKPLARIVAYADAEQEPQWFTTAPTKAVPLALERAGLTTDDIDFFEINEAFAVVPLAFSEVLNVPQEKLNVFGGAVSIGHPLGASGARIVTTLTNVLQQKGGRYGAVGICNGGGGASALVLERL
ncbi:thiolase family protein [Spirosoma utsteinense]|uniref:acetyl-CoA C-acetyltransferase n=1 Tax=Spirosoma utsteinense TaxID=2585773 RepID=A0ABR6WBE3_9BACT|nr:acetyl-CoA C-acyltransferase [Spirosoma utsteinense]MBC3785312.1 acetyl-CoA C-acetyltransferase [Spirosoma utsteinense]MBC3793884.1 acetyl-CoA C-acetyltransferase [Spirosoma utsteinense]